MRINEILTEKTVESSWLRDITFNRNKNVARMDTVSRGVRRVYEIHGMTRHQFDRWHRSPSKGRFFQKEVLGFYDIYKIHQGAI